MEIRLGEGAELDQGVILGYRPGRRIKLDDLIIGRDARIRSHTVIYSNVMIGDYLETGHNVVIREENQIGDHLSIWNNSTIDYGCTIGNRVRIHNGVYVAQYTTIEDDVFLAPGVMIANDPHPICTKCMEGPTIRRGARIGIHATVLARIDVGEYALVGAGSVVTRDVPARTLVYGCPARVICSVDDLECPLDLVEHPYLQGLDVHTRERST
jgi:UDP-3-O-[3-hydroxymyristoyl] glucosamine N-acyltransferase